MPFDFDMSYITGYWGVDWVAVVATLVGIYLLGERNRTGFILAIIGNFAWFAFGIMSKSGANLLANVLFFALNLRGYYKWKQAGKNEFS